MKNSSSDTGHRRSNASRSISRREFLKGMGVATAGLLIAGCRSGQLVETPTPESTSTVAPTVSPTVTPTIPPTVTPTIPPAVTPTIPPLATPTVPSTAASSPAFVSRVAITQAESYERGLVRRQVQALLDGIGGVGDLIGSGDRVGIKVNLTGGTHFEPPDGVSAVESYLTHPEIVRALGELLRDAGARELFIVEAVYDAESYAVFGYEEIARAIGAALIDLNAPFPYDDFASAPVGEGWFIHQNYTFNHVLEEIDAFVSVSKMKCHFNCGVTLSMKNLIGLVPAANYRLDEEHWWRSALHAASPMGYESDPPKRLPRVILDLNRARPIHLALVDGIKSGEGGEVPRGTFAPVEPHVLLAGKNPVATDSVAAAAMGFDPTAESATAPFIRCDNYLNMARELGLGTNHLEEIEVVGASLDDIRCQFEPSWEM